MTYSYDRRATKTKVIKKYPIPEDGVEYQVAEISRGFSVTFWDTDAGESMGNARIFPKKEKALSYAYTQAQKAGYKGRK